MTLDVVFHHFEDHLSLPAGAGNRLLPINLFLRRLWLSAKRYVQDILYPGRRPFANTQIKRHCLYVGLSTARLYLASAEPASSSAGGQWQREQPDTRADTPCR